MKLFKCAHLTPVEVPAVEGCENLNQSEDTSKVQASTEALQNNDQQPQQKPTPPPFQFAVLPKGDSVDNGRTFYFYLNEPAFFSEVMQLTNIISSCTIKDTIYLSIGGVVSMNAANLLVSELQRCDAYKVVDAPAIYNIYAGAVMSVCDEIVISPYMTAVYDYPQMSAGGGHNDAEEAIKFNKHEFEMTLELLVSKGFITSEEGERLKHQNLCTIAGDELVSRYQKFNVNSKRLLAERQK